MKVSELLVDKMIKNKIVLEEEREIYDYGVDQILFTSLNVCTMMVIGIVTHSLVTIVVFSLFYIILRIYAGGYHAKTQLKCFYLSNLMIMVLVGMDKLINMNPITQVGIVIVSSIVVLWLGPVDTITKRLDDKEHSVYRRRMIFILSFEGSIFIGCLLAQFAIVSKLITLSFLAVMIMLMGGVIDNRKRKGVEAK